MTDKEIICLMFGFVLGFIVALGIASIVVIANSLKRIPPTAKQPALGPLGMGSAEGIKNQAPIYQHLYLDRAETEIARLYADNTQLRAENPREPSAS